MGKEDGDCWTLWGIQKARKYGMFRDAIPAHWSLIWHVEVTEEKTEVPQQGAKLMASEVIHFFLIRRITPDLCVKRCTQPSMEAGVFSFLGGCIVLNTLMTGLAMLKEHSSFSATGVQNEQVCLQNCRIGLIAEFWNHDNSGYYESWNLPI